MRHVKIKETQFMFEKINPIGKEVVFLGFKSELIFDFNLFKSYFDIVEIDSKQEIYILIKYENLLEIPFKKMSLYFEQSCIYLLDKNSFTEKNILFNRYLELFFTPYLQIDRSKKLISFPNTFNISIVSNIYIMDCSSSADNFILQVSLDREPKVD